MRGLSRLVELVVVAGGLYRAGCGSWSVMLLVGSCCLLLGVVCVLDLKKGVDIEFSGSTKG